MNLTKMRRMLAIIVSETHLPKFLELFNAKTVNDFSLNKMGQPELIETNKEALNYLFHAICRDEFYTSLNTRVNLFINKLTESYPKDDISVLDSLELEDLIEFSFYYIFTLLYTDFNASLKVFNSQLLYAELVTLSIFANCKLKDLEVLEKRKNEEINKFFEKTFKNRVEYSLHKKNILEEIKLNLDTFQDIKRILSDTKSLEDSLKPKLESSLVPMPEKNLLADSLKGLEKKQKICELEYQKVEKHKFINKPKSITLSKTNEAQSKKNTEIECNKTIDYFYESLSCLSENLSETLKHIKENTQDINQFRQKISSAIGQISSSIQKLLSSLNGWKNPNETPDLSSLSLPKQLELVEELVIKKTLNVRQYHKRKLIQLQELLSNFSSLIELLIGQVNSIINKYHNYNNEAEKILNMPSSFFIENRSQFFYKSLPKKVKRQINGKLSNDYIRLKEQSNWLEKIIRLIKCDTDDRVIKLFAIIKEKDADYLKIYSLLEKKIKAQSYIKENNDDNGNKIALPQSIPLVKEDVEEIPARNLSEEQSEKFVPSVEKSLCSEDAFKGNNTELSLVTEVLKSTNECNKIRIRLEEEYINKERAKADLKAAIPDNKYNFLMSRIDPLNTSIPTTSIKTIADNNQSQPETSCFTDPATLGAVPIETNIYNPPQFGPAVYLTPAPIMFYPAPMFPQPTAVVDNYRLESRTVFYSI